MNTVLKNVAVFCGSSTGSDAIIIEDSLNLARILCSKGIGMVYGGGNVGLMGVIADEMIRLGGQVIGVIPEKLVEIEVAHQGITKLHIVKGMHERKALMASLADAFIILPGGIGTMEEFFEIYTWLQLGYHEKPIALVNINGFYRILLDFLERLVQLQFVKRNQIDRLIIEENSMSVINRLISLSRASNQLLS